MNGPLVITTNERSTILKLFTGFFSRSILIWRWRRFSPWCLVPWSLSQSPMSVSSIRYQHLFPTQLISLYVFGLVSINALQDMIFGNQTPTIPNSGYYSYCITKTAIGKYLGKRDSYQRPEKNSGKISGKI